MITQIGITSGEILNLIDQKERPVSIAEVRSHFPVFMGLSLSKNQRRKVIQTLEREINIDELKEFSSQKDKTFAVLGIFRLLKENMRKIL